MMRRLYYDDDGTLLIMRKLVNLFIYTRLFLSRLLSYYFDEDDKYSNGNAYSVCLKVSHTITAAAATDLSVHSFISYLRCHINNFIGIFLYVLQWNS